MFDPLTLVGGWRESVSGSVTTPGVTKREVRSLLRFPLKFGQHRVQKLRYLWHFTIRFQSSLHPQEDGKTTAKGEKRKTKLIQIQIQNPVISRCEEIIRHTML